MAKSKKEKRKEAKETYHVSLRMMEFWRTINAHGIPELIAMAQKEVLPIYILAQLALSAPEVQKQAIDAGPEVIRIAFKETQRERAQGRARETIERAVRKFAPDREIEIAGLLRELADEIEAEADKSAQ